MFFLYSVRSPHRTAKPSRGCLPLAHPRALPAVMFSDRRSPSAMCEFPFECLGCLLLHIRRSASAQLLSLGRRSTTDTTNSLSALSAARQFAARARAPSSEHAPALVHFLSALPHLADEPPCSLHAFSRGSEFCCSGWSAIRSPVVPRLANDATTERCASWRRLPPPGRCA
jgi:hypothetical protein